MTRLGVIGFGRRMRHMLDVITRCDAGAEVVAVVDPKAEGLQREFSALLSGVTFYDDAETMLDQVDLDGVLIGTRCSSHTPLAIMALERKLPLFLEKPVAISWEQLAALEEAAARAASPVVVSFPLRVSEVCQAAREIIDSGVIGSVEHVQAVNNVPFYATTYYHGWMRDDEETGGLWLQKATHDLDYLNYLIDQPPVQVCAMESKTVFTGDMPAGLHCAECERQASCPESPYHLFVYLQEQTHDLRPDEWQCSFAVDTGNHDSASAIIRYQSGLHAVYTQNFYTRRGAAQRGATVIGYRGTVSFDWYRDEVTVHHRYSNRVERHQFEPVAGGHHGGDQELARDFLAALGGTSTSRTPLAAGLLSARMCLAARDSCRTGQSQTIRSAAPVPA